MAKKTSQKLKSASRSPGVKGSSKKGSSKAKGSKSASRSPLFSSAVKVYEAGVKLMFLGKFDRAKAKFEELISRYPSFSELLDRANGFVLVCEQKIQEQNATVSQLKTADEYYECGIAELNRKELNSARDYFQSAVELSPTADHVHYAFAAVFALEGERDASLESLKKAIEYRDENRFQAMNDSDFEFLFEDSAFINLVSPDEN